MDKILALVGTGLAWLPIAATGLITIFGTIQSGRLRFDYLMPAELFPAALAGGLLLAWAALRVQRREGLALIDKLLESDMDKKSRHAELGVVTLSELLHEWAAHDLVHTMQAERALMQPFIRGCGPWQIYFEEHIISGGSSAP